MLSIQHANYNANSERQIITPLTRPYHAINSKPRLYTTNSKPKTITPIQNGKLQLQ